MAADMFLKIDGPAVPGESKDKTHSGEIEVLSFSWGVSQVGTGAYGSGGLGGAKANFQDFTISKYVDKASAKLNLAVSDGTHFGKFTITVRKAGGAEPVGYMIYTLENVIVTSYQIGGITMFTREPSGSRASTYGEASSTRRPRGATMRWMMRMMCSSSRNLIRVL